jgi:hypothetical protein
MISFPLYKSDILARPLEEQSLKPGSALWVKVIISVGGVTGVTYSEYKL